jgi:hypothetical protein
MAMFLTSDGDHDGTFTRTELDQKTFKKLKIERRGGGAPGGGGAPPPLKLEKNCFFWRKIVIFHTKYPNNFRVSIHSAQFF